MSVHGALPQDNAVSKNPFLWVTLSPIDVLGRFVLAVDERVIRGHSQRRPNQFPAHFYDDLQLTMRLFEFISPYLLKCFVNIVSSNEFSMETNSISKDLHSFEASACVIAYILSDIIPSG
jgi:hypothetical protein